MSSPHRADAQTPEDVRDIRNAVEHRLFRGQTIANVLCCLGRQYEEELRIDEPFTLHDLRPDDLRITLEVLSEELEQAHTILSTLAPKLL
jgi:hypothetical protein